MIYGVGTDIVRVERIAAGLERFGERFARRILADVEWEEFRRNTRPARFLAKRFAAKEAAAKAFGTGFSEGIAMRHIVVVHSDRGQPLLEFHARAAEFVAEKGIVSAHLSISDEDSHAIAFVTLVSG